MLGPARAKPLYRVPSLPVFAEDLETLKREPARAPSASRSPSSSWTRSLARLTRGAGNLRLYLILSLPAFWLLLFLVVPLAFVFVYGFGHYNEAYALQLWPLDGTNYVDAFALGRGAIVIPLLARTFAVAALTTMVALAVGYAMAYYIARIAKERWRGILMGLVVVPFWVSFIVRIYAISPFTNGNSFFHVWLQSNHLGFLSGAILSVFELGTGQMLVFTLMYVWLPFMILPLFASLSKLDPQLLEAAYDLGASRWRAFLHVTLPLTLPAMIVGSILTFITAVGAFIEPSMVGGQNWQLIGNYIQDEFSLSVGLPQASASALFLIFVTVLLITVYRKYAEIEEEGETEVRSRIIAPIWNWLKDILKIGRPTEGSPAETTMPDGGTTKADPSFLAETSGGPVHKASWEKALDKVTEKSGKWILGLVTALVLLSFFVPLIITAAFSFNSQDDLNIWHGFSLRFWTGTGARDGLFQDETATASIGYSFLIAGLSSVIATGIGLLAAFAIVRYKFVAKGFLRTLMYLGLVIPSLILGVSLAILIRFLNYYLLGPLSMGYGSSIPAQWDYGLSSIIVGHTTFNIPLATLVLVISFKEYDWSLNEAAMNLGADEITTFLRVTLPNIMPGIISAILLGFTFSFDELPVTLFLYGSGVQTVPIVIYGLITKKTISPRVNAMATIILVLSIAFVAITTRLGKKGGQLFRI